MSVEGQSLPPDPPTLKPAVQSMEIVENKKRVFHEFQHFAQPLRLIFRLHQRQNTTTQKNPVKYHIPTPPYPSTRRTVWRIVLLSSAKSRATLLILKPLCTARTIASSRALVSYRRMRPQVMPPRRRCSGVHVL